MRQIFKTVHKTFVVGSISLHVILSTLHFPVKNPLISQESLKHLLFNYLMQLEV